MSGIIWGRGEERLLSFNVTRDGGGSMGLLMSLVTFVSVETPASTANDIPTSLSLRSNVQLVDNFWHKRFSFYVTYNFYF